MTKDEFNDYRCWKKWMEFGSKTGCHQRADRSFFIKGYQMPVCARCTGVIIGYMIAIPGYFLLGFHKAAAGIMCVPLLIDWFLQKAGIKESTNRRRFLTGIFAGYGIMSLQLFLVHKIVKTIVGNK